jgi:uncharacterized protein
MKTVAILGASTNPDKYGNRAVRAFGEKGFEVFPVNPRADEIAGCKSYPDIAAVPKRPDVVSLYLPPALLLQELPRIKEKGCAGLWLNPGTDTPEVVALAAELGLNAVVGCSLVGLVSGRLSADDE